jgi:rod shape-determining protein MreB
VIGLSTRVGLDPGTANTLLYVKGRGILLNEPSLLTVRTSTGAIEFVGGEAEAGRGRTPRKFETARPIRAGVITDLRLFDGMLRRFLRKAHIAGPLHRLRVAIAVPSGLTEVERLAIVDSLRDAGAAEVVLVDQAIAAARGAGLAIGESRGRMVVNIGAGVTDVAVLSIGGAVYARSTRVAGDDFDAAISTYVRARHGLLIGDRTAERLKIRIGSAAPGGEDVMLPVKGRCMTTGVPREAVVHAREVREAIAPVLGRIAGAVREALEQTPPEVSGDLTETGIVLTGGSALLSGLDRYLGERCGLPVEVADDPLSCVIRGLAYHWNHPPAIDWGWLIIR